MRWFADHLVHGPVFERPRVLEQVDLVVGFSGDVHGFEPRCRIESAAEVQLEGSHTAGEPNSPGGCHAPDPREPRVGAAGRGKVGDRGVGVDVHASPCSADRVRTTASLDPVATRHRRGPRVIPRLRTATGGRVRAWPVAATDEDRPGRNSVACCRPGRYHAFGRPGRCSVHGA